MAPSTYQSYKYGVSDRLPVDEEVVEMLANVETVWRSLKQVRENMQDSIQNKRTHDSTKSKSNYKESEGMPLYGDITKAEHPVKKRMRLNEVCL